MSNYVPFRPNEGPEHKPDNCWYCMQVAERESRIKMFVTVLIVIATVGIIYGMIYALGFTR